MEKIYYSRFASPIGMLLLAATENGLYRVQFGAALPDQGEGKWLDCPSKLAETSTQLGLYFAGKLRDFTLPLDLRGTPFQILCWEALRSIPYGATSSYGEIARRVGRPRAFRAVGQANHDNPIAIIVPCHRVIGTNGKLTGYGGGLSIKEKLLRLETGEPQKSLAFREAI